MAAAINPHGVTSSPRPTPDLPEKLTALAPVVIVGIGLWSAALVVLFVLQLGRVQLPAGWFWTCIAGVGLGFLGWAIIIWQRAAARRGTKGAQRGI